MKTYIRIFLLSVMAAVILGSCQKEDPIDYATVLSGNWKVNNYSESTDGVSSTVDIYLKTNYTYNYTITINDGGEAVKITTTGSWDVDPASGTINFYVSDNETSATESGKINLAENSITINGQQFGRN